MASIINSENEFDELMIKLNNLTVIDNLTTNDTANPLSANQGKILSEMIDNQIQRIINQNLLINGNFQIFQRGTSFTVGTSDWSYTADRWRVKSLSGNITVSKVADGLKVSGACSLQYVLSPNDLEALTGNVVTLSYSINGDIQQPTTFTISSKTVVNLTLSANDVVNWVKLELGSVATPRVIRPFVEELQNCLAYYEVIEGAKNLVSTGTAVRLFLEFAVPKVNNTYTISALDYSTGSDLGFDFDHKYKSTVSGYNISSTTMVINFKVVIDAEDYTN